MTDATLTAPTSRTLLLTFFFRQMPQTCGARQYLHRSTAPVFNQKGKSARYIRDEKEFRREVLRRATEDHAVEFGGTDKKLEGGELTNFLMAFWRVYRFIQQAGETYWRWQPD